MTLIRKELSEKGIEVVDRFLFNHCKKTDRIIEHLMLIADVLCGDINKNHYELPGIYSISGNPERLDIYDDYFEYIKIKED